mmetsp:Transcript_20342/g.65028  ORF Transcript_20342/g.65028 Transcript_20342/m.65028 type:complete len:258 (+) Transcript_20342:235-1008(+)
MGGVGIRGRQRAGRRVPRGGGHHGRLSDRAERQHGPRAVRAPSAGRRLRACRGPVAGPAAGADAVPACGERDAARVPAEAAAGRGAGRGAEPPSRARIDADHSLRCGRRVRVLLRRAGGARAGARSAGGVDGGDLRPTGWRRWRWRRHAQPQPVRHPRRRRLFDGSVAAAADEPCHGGASRGRFGRGPARARGGAERQHRVPPGHDAPRLRVHHGPQAGTGHVRVVPRPEARASGRAGPQASRAGADAAAARAGGHV